MRRFLALLVALLGAGCAAEPQELPAPSDSDDAPPGTGSGGAAHSRLPGGAPCAEWGAWRERGLYQALAARAGEPGLDVRVTPLPPGLPLRDDALEARWSGYALERLALTTPAPDAPPEEGSFTFALEALEAPRVRIAGMFPHSAPDAEVRETLLAFLERVFADEPRLQAWADAFVARREPGMEMARGGEAPRVVADTSSMDVEATPALDALWRTLDAQETLVGQNAVMRAEEGEGRWEARFVLPKLDARLAGEPVLDLRVGGSGLVRATSPEAPPADDADRQRILAEAFERNGMARPTFEGWSAGPGEC